MSSSIPLSETESRHGLNAGGGRRVIQLDFVRGIAILMVLQFHFLAIPVSNKAILTFEDAFSRVGWTGVDLFFVLSGFLVGGLLVQELKKTGMLRVRRFIVRRMFKIWPAYYFYVAFQMIARKHPLNTFAWQNILNIQNYAGTTLKQTWSLAVEEHFYLILPLLLSWIYISKVRQKYLAHILVGICFLTLCLRTWETFGLHMANLEWPTQDRLDSLIFGVLLSYILYNHRNIFEKICEQKVLLLAVFGAGITFIYIENTSALMISFGYTINYLCMGSLLLLLYSYHGKFIRTWFYRTVAWIGVYSYGIYLWHLSVREPLSHAVTYLPHSFQWVALWSSQYVAAIVLGFLLTKAIEFPMLRIREKLYPRAIATSIPDSVQHSH